MGIRIERTDNMLAWIGNNIGTILISLVLLAVVVAIVRSMRKKKQQSSCGGGCSHCAMSNTCHPE